MSLVGLLIGFGVRQVIRKRYGDEAGEKAAPVIGPVVQFVEQHFTQHFTQHSHKLPNALVKANDRTWQALVIALAGDGFLDQVKVFFASGDDKGIREQVSVFLQANCIDFKATPADIRTKCLAELKTARKIGKLSAKGLSSKEIARHTAGFQRYADPKGLVDGAEQVMGQIAAELAADYPNLANLLRQRTSAEPPLLISAFTYFFRREVETDNELAHGLFFDLLRQLSASQAQAFAEVGKALTTMGDDFDQVLDRLGHIETVVVETHGAVLDMQTELHRLGSLPDEVRRLMEEVQQRVSLAGMHQGAVKPQHGVSIRSEDERTAVKQLLAQFRQLPAEQQKQIPALLNGLGKLQVRSGDFKEARQTFVAVAESVSDTAAKAEAHYNAFRAALAEKKWDEALAAIQQAAALDPQRFAPFPMLRYQPKKLLGAGGFGAAFLCHDQNFEEEVVVKILHDAAQGFREARVLRKLKHSAIIGVHECEYADPLKHDRPYIVMDYFPGSNLENLIQQSGTLSPDNLLAIAGQIAQGMQTAHQQNILHRDLKPDNILVRKDGESWQVKIIDFGLALRKQTNTSTVERSAGDTSDSIGTHKYAPPEQMGEMKGVEPGPYSDVYAFGKTCCFALFKTTEPKRRQWSSLPNELADMLEKCIEEELEHRLPSFEPVLQVLDALDSAKGVRKKQAEPRPKADLEPKQLGQEEAELLRKEMVLLENQGETRLSELVREALDRTQGKPTHDDTAAAKEICQQHRIGNERAKQIIHEVREQWHKTQPAKLDGKLHPPPSSPATNQADAGPTHGTGVATTSDSPVAKQQKASCSVGGCSVVLLAAAVGLTLCLLAGR